MKPPEATERRKKRARKDDSIEGTEPRTKRVKQFTSKGGQAAVAATGTSPELPAASTEKEKRSTMPTSKSDALRNSLPGNTTSIRPTSTTKLQRSPILVNTPSPSSSRVSSPEPGDSNSTLRRIVHNTCNDSTVIANSALVAIEKDLSKHKATVGMSDPSEGSAHAAANGDVARQVHHLTEHEKLLASKWLTTKELKRLSDEQGLIYKRGAFTNAEKAAIERALVAFAAEYRITREDAVNIIFAKRSSMDKMYKTFWHDLAISVPSRPLVSVFNFCRRAYHPLQKQGKWSLEEDEALLAGVAEFGQIWEKVSTRVGRMASDCRDRYRNHLQNVSDKRHGTWDPAEEAKLIQIMEELNAGPSHDGEGVGGELFWREVIRRMGGTRSRAQIKIKWEDSLSRSLKTQGQRKWLAIDTYILLHKLDSMDLMDESDIDWKLCKDEEWDIWSPHVLQKRWNHLKTSVEGYESMSYRSLLAILIKKKNLSPAEIEAGINRMTIYPDALGEGSAQPRHARLSRTRAYMSRDLIEDSDVASEKEGD